MKSSFTRFELAVTDTLFTLGPCDGLYFAKTITTSGCIGTCLDDTTIDLGLVPIGTELTMQFKKVVFAGGPAGAVVACYYPSSKARLAPTTSMS